MRRGTLVTQAHTKLPSQRIHLRGTPDEQIIATIILPVSVLRGFWSSSEDLHVDVSSGISNL